MSKHRKVPRYQQNKEKKPQADPLRNRIEADIAQQAPHNSYGGVPLYYEDQEFTCIDCGKAEIWTAKQQKWWYETAKGYIFSTAIRCHSCRKALIDRHGGIPRKSHQDRNEKSTDT